MITNKTRLRLVGKMIEVKEKELAALADKANDVEKRLDRLYVRRSRLEADIAMEERDTAPLVKTQPAGVKLDGYSI